MMKRPLEIFSPEERAALLRHSDLHAWALVIGTWAISLMLLGVAGLYPGVLTTLLVLLLLPGRQLSLAVLMHEAGHGSLFERTSTNRWVGQWLCALPTFADLDSYARGHLEHHRQAGTDKDPDLVNYAIYPISRASLRRKITRDLTGQTGIKLLAAVFGGGTGIVGTGRRQDQRLLLKQVSVQLTLFTVLSLLGIGWTYWLWLATFLTTFMLVIRLRQIAEHAAVPNLFDLDPRQNTRTVVAPWWQHFLLAPSNVNYHMEHHYMPGVPCYRLKDLRTLLKVRGCLDHVTEYTSYGQVLRTAVTS